MLSIHISSAHNPLSSLLGMLCACCSENEAFGKAPSTTNAVELHNRVSKGTSPDILSVAMMTTYKVDMSAALEHLASSQGIPTSYDELTPAARAKRSKTANKARSRKRAGNTDSDGPPDKHRDFKKGMLAQTQARYNVVMCTVNVLLFMYFAHYGIFLINMYGVF